MKHYGILKVLILTAVLGTVSACNDHAHEEGNIKEHSHSHEEEE